MPLAFLVGNFPANVYGAKTITGLPSDKRLVCVVFRMFSVFYRYSILGRENIVYLYFFDIYQ